MTHVNKVDLDAVQEVVFYHGSKWRFGSLRLVQLASRTIVTKSLDKTPEDTEVLALGVLEDLLVPAVLEFLAVDAVNHIADVAAMKNT